ncbi:MAG: 2-C-methyl-D-erythritol 4-phosphate cytidylyltransferase [Bacteroidales bacterium]|nr:2-C-methyl-D-erythritol 4-phosphate cytidylyltransferase [Bacteroidales bacterium]MDE6802068.1 2-C-methyl-D-erythritol 4-phosphate cytidylyltransferase [Muribaculaceae bacterium]
MESRKIYFVIVAGGTGSRFGADLPKQYCMMSGKPVLCHTIRRARIALPSAEIITVISEQMRDFWLELSDRFKCEPTKLVTGGATRWESVKNALQAIQDTDPKAIVLIHDAARPLLDKTTADALVEAVEPETSVVPVMPVTDSLRYINKEGVSIAVDRADFRAVATPQAFRLTDLKEAYRLPYDQTFTDDASVMAAAGKPLTKLVDVTSALSKITSPGDIARLESLL